MAPEAGFRVYQLAVAVGTGRDLAPRDLAEKACVQKVGLRCVTAEKVRFLRLS